MVRSALVVSIALFLPASASAPLLASSRATEARFDWAGLVLVRPGRTIDEPGTGAPPLPAGQDGDGFPDTDETVDLSVLLSNKSGQSLSGVSVRLWSTDPKVDCIANPVIVFGAIAPGATVPSPAPFRFRVAATADRGGTAPPATCAAGACSNGAGSCVVAADCARTALDAYAARFHATVTANELPAGGETDIFAVELDLNSTTAERTTSSFVEGFEGGAAGVFFMNLDDSLATNALSDGRRCPYNDPDAVNSNSPGDPWCYLGFATGQAPVNDWHLHDTSAVDGGRAFAGLRSLHYGIHSTPGLDTYGLSQLDAVRTRNPVHLAARICRDDPAADPRSCNEAADCAVVGGGPCVAATPELSFRHQVSLEDDRSSASFERTTDRAVVQVRTTLGTVWQKAYPYENGYDRMSQDTFSNCTFDPIDDGNDEDDYFQPGDPMRRLGPSSTCAPEFAFAYLGDTDAPYAAANVGRARDGGGLPGSLGIGTWVTSRFDLSAFRGRSVTVRWLVTSVKLEDFPSHEAVFHYNPNPVDDGWYLDDVRMTQTLATFSPTASLDATDRSTLPTCAGACAGVTADLDAIPAPSPAPGYPVGLSSAGSIASSCPGGELLREFWVDADASGTLGVPPDYAFTEATFGASAAVTPDGTTSYGVRVRCAADPSCADDATATVIVECPPAGTYSPVEWSSTLRFTSKSFLATNDAGQSGDMVRGLLSSLRAGGAFGAESCLRNDTPLAAPFDFQRPPSGDGYYYLLRGSEPWCAEASTWSTEHPKENPGDPGKRDREITVCPAP